eukprot:49837-Pleurochrysis_carterae.AAC.2
MSDAQKNSTAWKKVMNKPFDENGLTATHCQQENRKGQSWKRAHRIGEQGVSTYPKGSRTGRSEEASTAVWHANEQVEEQHRESSERASVCAGLAHKASENKKEARNAEHEAGWRSHQVVHEETRDEQQRRQAKRTVHLDVPQLKTTHAMPNARRRCPCIPA